jgi:hypothetical protein
MISNDSKMSKKFKLFLFDELENSIFILKDFLIEICSFFYNNLNQI